MYSNNSLSELRLIHAAEQDQLNGLFKTLGKIISAPIKIATKLAPAVIAGVTGIPIAAILASGSPNQPYTGAGGVAISDADRIAAMVAAQNQRNAPAYLQPGSNVVQAGFIPASTGTWGGGLPAWIMPVGIAAVAGIVLIAVLKK